MARDTDMKGKNVKATAIPLISAHHRRDTKIRLSLVSSLSLLHAFLQTNTAGCLLSSLTNLLTFKRTQC